MGQTIVFRGLPTWATPVRQLREALKIDPQARRLDSTPAASAQAERAYRAALAVNPFDGKSECRPGEVLCAVRIPSRHWSVYEGRQVQPDDAEAVTGLAKTLSLSEQPDKAQLYFERAAILDPLDAVTHYRLAGF